jgi:hypothetical protein
MNKIKYLSILLILTLPIACSDDPTSSKNPSYQIFPDGYFSAGYREDYTLSGVSDSGPTFTGSYTLVTQSPKQFNNEQVVPIQIFNEWFDQLNTRFSSFGNTNYSTDLNNLQIIGFEDLGINSSSILTDRSSIPKTAKINDSGILGTFQDNLGNIITYTWALEKADGNNASIVFASTARDPLGNLVIQGNTTWIINSSGQRQSLTILFDFIPFNDPVRWTGVKQ